MSAHDELVIQPRFAALVERIGLDAPFVFASPKVAVWRKLADRENCTLDAEWPDGRPARLHVKRYPGEFSGMAQREAMALAELEKRGIPTAPLVAWGRVADGRSFVATEDLSGYQAADKLVAAGEPFERLLEPTAALAGRLHQSGLHHRDLYLCHFLVKLPDVRLIDAARVRPLPGWPLRRRWIVKDLAQFWYSTTQVPITDAQRVQWMNRYAQAADRGPVEPLIRSVKGKSGRIAAHDARLNRREPTRNISIPRTPGS